MIQQSTNAKTSGDIVVVAVGDVAPTILAHLCGKITKMFGGRCRLGDTLPTPQKAFEPFRQQYSAKMILDQLHPEKSDRILGVTDVDLFVPELNFVFGVADLPGERAVIALPRLRQQFYGKDEDETLFLGRTIKEAVHELGHTHGLAHCSNPRCVMMFSKTIEDTDYKDHTFCPICRRQMRP